MRERAGSSPALGTNSKQQDFNLASRRRLLTKLTRAAEVGFFVFGASKNSPSLIAHFSAAKISKHFAIPIPIPIPIPISTLIQSPKDSPSIQIVIISSHRNSLNGSITRMQVELIEGSCACTGALSNMFNLAWMAAGLPMLL